MKYFAFALLAFSQVSVAVEKTEIKRMPAAASKGDFVCGHNPTSPYSAHEFLNKFCDNSKPFTVTHVQSDGSNNLEGIIVCCVQK